MPDRFAVYSAGGGVWGVEDLDAQQPTDTGVEHTVAIIGPFHTAQQILSLLEMNAIPSTGLAWTKEETEE
jgi:hypothetical protein